MNKLYNSFLTTFCLISRIPVSFIYKTDFSMFGFFFPVTGLIVSALVLGLFSLLNPLLFNSGITIFLILIIQYVTFNLFHFDGLLDCADAFLYNTTKKKRLAILSDKRTGAFAVFSGTVYILFKIHLLFTSVSIVNLTGLNWIWILILFSYPLTGRIAGSIMPAIIAPAENPGLAELLKNYSLPPVLLGTLLSLSLPIAIIILTTPVSVKTILYLTPFAGTIIAGTAVSILSKKMVGGYTGDSIGLTIETGEIIHLIIITEILGRLF